MIGQVSFRGQSGKAWRFQRVAADSPWARNAGVVIFAGQEACGWRVFRVMELTGRPHDIQPIWALAEAERFGASAVFVAMEFDGGARRAMVADLEAGFTPVCRAPQAPVRMAA
ncbi:hypothetical protein [Hyphomonas sp.]|uniref:hypothetical protein n=1 Tax=Hyphomonas sp. TaxID=87 RepID=UPI003919C7C2